MTVKYDAVYQEGKHILGAPFPQIVDFFNELENSELSVLDIGAGQGRDAVFIATQGHSVTAVDISEVGLRDLELEAQEKGLNIQCVLDSAETYVPTDPFDILLLDRTLHMLSTKNRTKCFKRLIGYVKSNGYVVVADELSNLPALEQIIDADTNNWSVLYKHNGFRFWRRVN